MMSLHERIARELMAERAQVPPATRPPIPSPGSSWPKRLALVAAVVLFVAGGWMFSRVVLNPAPATGVTVTGVAGDEDPEVIATWKAWWEAWAEVRATATAREDGSGWVFSQEPFRDLAADHVAETIADDTIFTMDRDGSLLIGMDTTIRLAPEIQVEGDHAVLRDCVYMDPVPWVVLRHPGSTGGTVAFIAEMERTQTGWLISVFGTESPIDQINAELPCAPGQP